MPLNNTETGEAIVELSHRILFEDNHLIAVNKRPGELTQGDKTGDAILPDLVKAYLKERYNKPGDVFLGVAHRIDRPVSGVVCFARTSKALSRLNELFRSRETEKIYYAVVSNEPPRQEDTLVQWMLKNEENNKSKVFAAEKPGTLRVELHYRVINKSERHFLIEVKPLTGRHHQIRAQLASMGCPIRGDVKYGYNRPNPDKSIHLHARSLSFLHPVRKEPLRIEAPLPQEKVWQLFQ